MAAYEPARRCRHGVERDAVEGAADALAWDSAVSRTLLERAAGAGESPVGDGGANRVPRDA